MNKYIILGHENPDVDSIVSGYLLAKKLKLQGKIAELVIPDKVIEKLTVEKCQRYGINPYEYQRELINDDKYFILVDHHERDVPGEIVAIYDHHPTDKKIMVDDYHNYLISSTSLMMVMGEEEKFSDDDIKLAIVASFADTASFHSTKKRKEDIEWVERECQKRGFDYDNLYKEGIDLSPLEGKISDVARTGLKKYKYDFGELHSSYLHIANTKEDRVIIEKLVKYYQEYVKENKLKAFVFIVHDMNLFKTKVYLIMNDDMMEIDYDQYTSRGNNVLPDMEKILRKKYTL